MSVESQTRLVGEPGGVQVEFDTSGRVIRPLLDIPTAIVDEARVTFDADGITDSVCIAEAGGRLVIDAKETGESSDDITMTTKADFGPIAEETADYTGDDDDGAESLFSLDYLTDMAAGLKSGKVDKVTLRWGQEIPLVMEFARERDEEVLYGGQYFMAPRVTDSNEGGDV